MGWARTSLGEIGRYRNGRGFRKTEWSGSGRPIIRIQNLTETSSTFNYYDGDAEESYIARSGDVLISWAATLGVFVWRGPEAVVNQHIFKVLSHIDSGFHRYLVMSALDAMRRETHGSGMVHITRKRFDAIPVLLPPLAEQRRIVAAIEEHFSRLDASGLALLPARRRLQALRRLAIEYALRELPSRTLGEVARIAGGHTPRGLETTPGGTIPFFKVGDMNVADEAGRMTTARTYLSPDTAAAYRVRLWPAETIIFPKQGGAIATNKKRVLVQTAACDLNTMGVIPAEELDPRFLKTWFETVDLSALSDGSVVAQIKPSRVAGLEIPLPTLDEQRRIVADIEQQLSQIDALRAAVEAAQKRSAALRRAILERAFRGELVPQDPADEPASMLLERIRTERAAAPPPSRSRRAAV
jgi:type I restriction enzyme, S subunit